MQYLDIISTISIVIAAAGIIIAVIYYFFYIRFLRRARQADIFMRLFSTFMTREFSDSDFQVAGLEYTDYDDFLEKYGSFSSRKPIHIALRQVINFFEGVGVLLEEKLFDEAMVLKFLAVEPRWKQVAPIVKALSKEYKLEWFEYLYNLEKQHKPQ
jgi:hypothetical protein